MAKSWLLGSFSKDILGVVVDCSTSLEVWTALGVTIIASFSRPFVLQRKLQAVSKMEKAMDNYSKDTKTICSQLSSIGSPILERMKVFAALHGFGREYEPIKLLSKATLTLHLHLKMLSLA